MKAGFIWPRIRSAALCRTKFLLDSRSVIHSVIYSLIPSVFGCEWVCCERVLFQQRCLTTFPFPYISTHTRFLGIIFLTNYYCWKECCDLYCINWGISIHVQENKNKLDAECNNRVPKEFELHIGLLGFLTLFVISYSTKARNVSETGSLSVLGWKGETAHTQMCFSSLCQIQLTTLLQYPFTRGLTFLLWILDDGQSSVDPRHVMMY